jgi:hypothetical protein
MFGMAKTEQERLAELVAAIKALEEAADRIEKSGGMIHYPAKAREMAREHRSEARILWRKGVRPLPDGPSDVKNAP